MPQTLDDVFSQAQWFSDDTPYRLLQLPARAIMPAVSILAEVRDPFVAVIIDKDEITLLMPAALVEEFAERLVRFPDHRVSEKQYRLITLDVVLDFNLVGLMAHVTTALAKAGISVLTYAAYSRDHFFVTVEDFETALTILEQLKKGS
ncbi:MAG: hypothetical protein OHK0046_07480 [Anaerolineae bacterium]